MSNDRVEYDGLGNRIALDAFGNYRLPNPSTGKVQTWANARRCANAIEGRYSDPGITVERDAEIRSVLHNAEISAEYEPHGAQDQTIRRRWQDGLEAFGLDGTGLVDRYVLNEAYSLVGELSRYLTVTAAEGLRTPSGGVMARLPIAVRLPPIA